MKLSDLLAKLGILRKGTVTWKGKAMNRKMPFIDESVMNEKKDYTTAKDMRPGGKMALILPWIFGVAILLFGLLLMPSYLVSGIILAVLGLLLLPPIRSFFAQKLNFKLSRKVLLIIFIIGIILVFVFAGSQKDKNISMAVPVRAGQATEEGMKNLTIALDTLATRYKDAVDYQNTAANIPYGSLNVADARLIVAGSINLWDLVEQSANDLDKLTFPVARNGENAFSLIAPAFALEASDVEEPLVPGETGRELTGEEKTALEKSQAESKEFNRQELIKKKWKQADLARMAYPDKNWLTIVQAAFKEDAQSAKKRLDERNSQLQIEFKNEDDYNKRWVQGLTVAQTSGKVVLFVAAMPEVAAAQGAIAAGEILLAGVDVAFSVGDSVNIMMHDGEEALIYTQAKDAVAPLLMASSLKSVLQNPANWEKETILSLYDVGALAYDQAGGFSVLNVGKNPQVEYYDQSLQETFGPDGSGNESLPSYLKFSTKEQKRIKMEAAAAQLVERLKDPEYRNALIKMEADRLKLLEEQKAAATEQARKDAEIKKIMDRKELERAQAAKQKAAQDALKKLESTMPASDAISPKLATPAPTPPPVPEPQTVPANTTVSSCGLCAQSGLDCACGREACRCCAPGDSNCNAYDL